MRSKYIVYSVLFLTILMLSGCTQEKVPPQYKPSNAHKAYLYSLTQANLAQTALGKDWISASEKALQKPVEITAPFEEAFYVDPRTAFAVAYSFAVKTGQRTEIEVSFQSQQPGRLFMDLYRMNGDSPEEWVMVASAKQDELYLEFEARVDYQYCVRLQPELLRGGQFKVIIRNQASLGFPVAGRDRRDIGSGFGEPRDGGRRKHHGVDIFARRHTKVVAPSDAFVQRVGRSDIGGLNIWLNDTKRGLYLYFAHLQTQTVEENSGVKAGQVIGTVGNTGNARTTPPHLHFGIYRRGSGPVDPYNFIVKINATPKPISANLDVLGQWVRAKESHTPMQVLAANEDQYRALMPDGDTVQVQVDDIENVEEPLQVEIIAQKLALIEAPQNNAIAMDMIEAGSELYILGEYENYWFVKTHDGNTGWMLIPSPIAESHRIDTNESD